MEHVINPCKYQLYNDCFFGIYDSGVEPGDGEYYGRLAKKLSRAVSRAGQYSYIFDTVAKLCCVLELKSEIGIRTRKIYKDKDKKALDDLINDYNEMIERTKVFYTAFRKQWQLVEKVQRKLGFFALIW